MNTISKVLMILLCAVAVSACETTGDTKAGDEGGAVVEDRTAAGAEGAEAGAEGKDEGPETAALPGRDKVEIHPLDDPDSLLSTRVIYFDFDKSEVKAEFRKVLAAHAEYLAGNPQAQVTLEGHTDERGSREYNIGLGERRAEAVRRLLLFQGASDGQVRTVSYGEERPAARGHNEEAWQQNRRVELIYKR